MSDEKMRLDKFLAAMKRQITEFEMVFRDPMEKGYWYDVFFVFSEISRRKDFDQSDYIVTSGGMRREAEFGRLVCAEELEYAEKHSNWLEEQLEEAKRQYKEWPEWKKECSRTGEFLRNKKHSHKNPHNALCWRLKHAYKTPDDQLADMKLAAEIIEKYATLYGELT